MDRRAFLATGFATVTAAVAGCARGSGSSETEPRRLHLESVDIRTSPGGRIPIRPSGKVVLLDFFATWCPPCKPEMANLRIAREQFSRQTAFMVSITQETDEMAIKQFWRQYRGTWPVVMDPELKATRKYGVTGLPTIIVLTPDGTEVMRHTGLAGKEKILANIREALRKAEIA